MPDAPPTSYDELQYDDIVFGHSQPDNLATVAALHGLEPPPPDRCRALDIGCAAGANIFPMAFASPGGRFVGIDLSTAQIARGREMVTRLGLTNVTLDVRNILDPTDDLGTFDYIVCHGVYSWVPPAVQGRILDLIRRQLAPAGIAYVSYNTYPGWHLRGMARDLMAFHAAGLDAPPAVKTAEARAFLDFLVDALPEKDTSYASNLRREADYLRPRADSYVYHEYLEADNRPVYFHQFAAHAAAYGLQFLAEATAQPLPGQLKPGVLDTLAEFAGDPIRLEQYRDFLRCRVFRRSLLCHAAARPTRDGMAGRVPEFFVTSRAKPDTDRPRADPAAKELFVVSDQLRFSTADPLLRAALWRLWDARPAALSFADLLAAVRDQTPAGVDGARELADGILQLHLGDVIDLHLRPPTVAAAAGPRPCAAPFARLQAERGDVKVFSITHKAEPIDPFARYLLPLLDGNRTRPDLVDTLAARAAAGEFEVHNKNGEPTTDPAVLRDVLAGWVETTLGRLAKAALLTT
jgi:SAM-dependent methyltransferase/methyltransferase-like protein